MATSVVSNPVGPAPPISGWISENMQAARWPVAENSRPPFRCRAKQALVTTADTDPCEAAPRRFTRRSDIFISPARHWWLPPEVCGWRVRAQHLTAVVEPPCLITIGMAPSPGRMTVKILQSKISRVIFFFEVSGTPSSFRCPTFWNTSQLYAVQEIPQIFSHYVRGKAKKKLMAPFVCWMTKTIARWRNLCFDYVVTYIWSYIWSDQKIIHPCFNEY